MVAKGQLKSEGKPLAITHTHRGVLKGKCIAPENKNAQLKIQQMAFMLMAITLFFVLVGMFFIVIQVSNLRESASFLEEKNALLLVTKLANSPEFSCGEVFGTGNLNCIDEDKAMALKKNIDRYGDFWGVSNIQIRILYPAEEERECTFQNYPDCNIIKIREGEISSEQSNFVSLCRKEYSDNDVQDKCEIARIMVSYG